MKREKGLEKKLNLKVWLKNNVKFDKLILYLMEDDTHYVIDLQKLKFGDIILMKTYEDICQTIRDKSGSNFSHAMIYKGYYSCLESNDLAVNSVNPQRLLFFKEDDAAVFRLNDQKNIGQLVKGLQFASSIIGMGYASKREVLKSLSSTEEEAKEIKRQYCTRFVAQIFDKSGFSIVANPDYCSPAEIENSPLLTKIPILKEASPEEIELAESEGLDAYQNQVTHELLANARLATNTDLQSLDEIDDFLNSNPSKDNELNEILENSGYLNLGDIESNENPYFYDEVLFLQRFGITNAVDFSAHNLINEIVLNYNYEVAHFKYQGLFNETSLNYFESLAKCYKKQHEYSSKRLDIFKKFSAIFLSGVIVDETNYQLVEAVRFALVKLVAEQSSKKKAQFKIGDSVREKSGGSSMKIEGFEINKLTKVIDNTRAICTWNVKRKLKRKTFNTFDLILDEPFFTYTAIDGYDNIV